MPAALYLCCMNSGYRIKSFIKYLWYGKSRYWIHSPFVFSFVNDVMRDKREFYEYGRIEACRQKLLINHRSLTLTELGAGADKGKQRQVTVKDLVRNTAIPEKYGRLLFRMVNHFQPTTILEVGTGSGMSTLYLASARKKAKVITLEGNEDTATVATANFKMLLLNNITLLKGNFDDRLPEALQQLGKLNLAFIDGNHTPDATLRYFRQCLQYAHSDTILIFDDINWSTGMHSAWLEIIRHERVKLSIDLYRLGIVFLRDEFKKQENMQLYF